MNTVDEFVIQNIQRYPSLFPHRMAVLHHALCVIGNGYEWDEHGKVVPEYYEDLVPLWNYEEELKDLREIYGEDLWAEMGEPQVKKLDEYQDRVNRAQELAVKSNANSTDNNTGFYYDGLTEKIYPQSNYALLMNIPDNVSPEWMEACEEMKVEAIENGWKF